MSVSKARLVNKLTNETLSIFENNKNSNSDLSIIGKIKIADCWVGVDHEKEWCFDDFAEVYLKWDGCSEFKLYGEEDMRTQSTDRSLYHFCGVNYYLQFMRQFIFAYEILAKHCGEDKILEKDELYKLRQLNLLEDYEIVYE